MLTRLALNSNWQLMWTEFGAYDRPWLVKAHSVVVNASVPGCAQADLMKEKILPDLYYGMNQDHAYWMEYKDWWYRTEFATPTNVSGKKIYLVFHGLDTYSTIWFNGDCIGTTDNMFVRYEFDVTDRIKASGSNELVVRFGSPLLSIPVNRNLKNSTFSSERLFCRKAQMSFGWDIAPRILTVGIWRPVELVIADEARISNVRIEYDRPDENGRIKLRILTEIDWAGHEAGKGELVGKFHDQRWEMPVAFKPGKNRYSKELVLQNLEYWWPRGYGPQTLIEYDVTIRNETGILDGCQNKTGIRFIELVQPPRADNSKSFRFKCNDKDIFVTGFNWTPIDAIFTRITEQRITEMLEKVAATGCNMLRVWGGGIYECQHFYNECDRLGIMIWQDFMMACGQYPQEDWFIDQIRTEARQVVKNLRNHPSLALWCGDNECDLFSEDPSQNIINRSVLKEICFDLCPEVPYLISTPCSPSGSERQMHTEGTSHCWLHGTNYKDPRMWNIKPRFVAEFGHMSLPSVELVKKYFPPGTDWPLTSTVWRYHTANVTNVTRFRTAKGITNSLTDCGKPVPNELATMVLESQSLQAEAMCAWINRYCEDPLFGGFLIWNVSDCWPQMSDSVFEYGGKPKEIYNHLSLLFAELQKKFNKVKVVGTKANAAFLK